MKIKYLFLCFVFSGLHGFFGSTKLWKAEIAGDKVVKGDQITKNGKYEASFHALVGFNKAVKEFRDAKDDMKLSAAETKIRDYLESFKPYNSADSNVCKSEKKGLYVHNVGAVIDGKFTNLLIALARIKDITNFQVGLLKTFYSASIFLEIFKNIFKNPEAGRVENLSCVFFAKDDRSEDLFRAAIDSGNFLFIHIFRALENGELEATKKWIGQLSGKKNIEELEELINGDNGQYSDKLKQAFINFQNLGGRKGALNVKESFFSKIFSKIKSLFS